MDFFITYFGMLTIWGALLLVSGISMEKIVIIHPRSAFGLIWDNDVCCYLFEEDSFLLFHSPENFSLSGLEFVLLRSNTSFFDHFFLVLLIKTLNPISLVTGVKLFYKLLKLIEKCVRYSFYKINSYIVWWNRLIFAIPYKINEESLW